MFNPYNQMLYNSFPYSGINMGISKPTLFSSFRNSFGKIKWGALLNNTQKTLNVINQAIPVYYQIKPVYNNAKTMFKVLGSIKNDSKDNSIIKDNNKKNISSQEYSNKPIFFTD